MSLTWSPDGGRIAASNRDDVVNIWNVDTGEKITQFSNNTTSVTDVIWSPDGSRLVAASSSFQSKLMLWDMTAYEELPVIDVEGFITCVAWSPDSTRIAGSNPQGVMKIWNVSTGELLFTFDTRAEIISLSWHPDGSRLTTLSSNNVIDAWDVATGQLLTSFQKHSDPTEPITWRPNDDWLAVAHSNSPNIDILDVSSGELQFILETPSPVALVVSVTDLAWSPDGRLLATAFEDQTINIWDLSDGEPSAPLEIRYEGRALSLAWSADSRRLASTWGDDQARQLLIWDTLTGNLLNAIHVDQLGWVQWSPDGSLLATFTWNNGIQLWDADTYQSIQLPPGSPNSMTPVSQAVWNPASNVIVGAQCSSQVDDCGLWVWDFLTGEISEPFDDDMVGSLRSSVLAWSPDGSVLAASDDSSRVVYIWSAETGELLATLEGFINAVNSLSWSSDSRMLAISDGVIHIWSS